MQPNTKKTELNYRLSAIFMGICYLLAFAVYGTGATIINNITSGENILATVAQDNVTIVIGAILMAVIQPLFIAIPIIALPILKPFNRYIAYGYLASSIVSMLCLIIGAILLLLLIPVADEFIANGATITPFFKTQTAMLIAGANYSYLIGMSIWPIGGMLFCVVLFQSRLVPRFLSIWGFVGYALHLAGSLSEMFTFIDWVQIVSLAPGGLFEVFLAFFLIFKGFNLKSQAN